MRVVLFKNIISENRPAMMRYGEELSRYMPGNVKEFSIKGKRLPFIKNYLHKEFIYPVVAAKNQGDVNHILDHSYAGLLRHLDPQRTVLTCHDLIPFDFPSERGHFSQLRSWLNTRYLPRAVKIIAVSNYTKKRILAHFNYMESNIHVIYLGVSEEFKSLNNRQGLRDKYNFKTKTVLHVGSCYPRKNVEIILKALVKNKNIIFVKVGIFSELQEKFIIKNKLEDRIIQMRFINNKQLAELYNAVDITLMPSFAEGFGWPAVEAMACGCPVICSNIEIFHELHKEAVAFFNPNDENELNYKINAIFNDASFRENLINKATERVKLFDWKKCTQQTYKVYEEIYNG